MVEDHTINRSLTQGNFSGLSVKRQKSALTRAILPAKTEQNTLTRAILPAKPETSALTRAILPGKTALPGRIARVRALVSGLAGKIA